MNKMKPLTEEDKKALTSIENRMWYGTCGAFIPSTETSSATICKNCGKEKWQH